MLNASHFSVCATILVLMTSLLSGSEPIPPATQPATNPAADDARYEKFEKTLTQAVLTGRFTVEGENKPAQEEQYTLVSVRKLKNDFWLFNARIQFGSRDITVPLIVPVKWAGDTPVISVTDMGIPGIGTYTARVVIYDDHYAGMWSGSAAHRGMLFGRIEHPAATTQPTSK